MATHPNRTPIAEIRTYDRHDCASTGYYVAVRADGTLRVELHNRWQGSMTDTVWIAPAPADIMATARGEIDDDEAPDLDVLIRDWLGTDWRETSRRIRLGYRVR